MPQTMKFTDKELIEEYKKGLSDKKIARIFKCSSPTMTYSHTLKGRVS